jgi:hypothetical protein
VIPTGGGRDELADVSTIDRGVIDIFRDILERSMSRPSAVVVTISAYPSAVKSHIPTNPLPAPGTRAIYPRDLYLFHILRKSST